MRSPAARCGAAGRCRGHQDCCAGRSGAVHGGAGMAFLAGGWGPPRCPPAALLGGQPARSSRTARYSTSLWRIWPTVTPSMKLRMTRASSRYSALLHALANQPMLGEHVRVLAAVLVQPGIVELLQRAFLVGEVAVHERAELVEHREQLRELRRRARDAAGLFGKLEELLVLGVDPRLFEGEALALLDQAHQRVEGQSFGGGDPLGHVGFHAKCSAVSGQAEPLTLASRGTGARRIDGTLVTGDQRRSAVRAGRGAAGLHRRGRQEVGGGWRARGRLDRGRGPDRLRSHRTARR